MTLAANAALDGAFPAGATVVVVDSNHGVEDLGVLLMDEIDPRCRVVRGAGRPGATTMSALDESCGVVLFVGHHAGAGSWPGIMAHTISYERFALVRVAGKPVGETDLFTIRAGEMGVPVGLVTGDQMLIEQLRKRVPEIEAVEVKRALSRQSGDVIPPARARDAIRAAAARAVDRAKRGELSPYAGEAAPYEIEVDLVHAPDDVMLANLAGKPEFALIGEKTIATDAPNMDVGFRRIAYLSYAHQANASRY
jgi:D-amino peptidase